MWWLRVSASLGCSSKSYEGENKVNLTVDEDGHLNVRFLLTVVNSRSSKLFLKPLK